MCALAAPVVTPTTEALRTVTGHDRAAGAPWTDAVLRSLPTVVAVGEVRTPAGRVAAEAVLCGSERCRQRKTIRVGRMTRIVPAGMISQCAPYGPLNRNSDVEITPRSCDGMERNGTQKLTIWKVASPGTGP